MKRYIYTIEPMTEEEKREFVQKCEETFEKQLEFAAQKIMENGSKIITLSGPTCSGKTTTAMRLISLIEKSGKRVGVISIDDFYKSREILNAESKSRGLSSVDYDSAMSIDLDYFEKCIDGILADKKVMLPVYSFEHGKRLNYYEFDSKKYSFIILEGIQAVYPEITGHIHTGFKSVQISVARDVEVNGSTFTSRQIRFLRRMVRDAKFRNAPTQITFEMWGSVSENEDLHIFPYERKCDIQIDSYMEYELFMMKKEVLTLLSDIGKDNEYYSKAEEIREKMSRIFEISAEYLPELSVYHEFLG